MLAFRGQRRFFGDHEIPQTSKQNPNANTYRLGWGRSGIVEMA